MRFTSEKKVRESVRKQILSLLKEATAEIKEDKSNIPAGDKVTNSELTKGLKMGAADIAASVPTAFNDEFAKSMNILKVMAEHDRSMFQKVVKIIEKYGQNALKKANK